MILVINTNVAFTLTFAHFQILKLIFPYSSPHLPHSTFQTGISTVGGYVAVAHDNRLVLLYICFIIYGTAMKMHVFLPVSARFGMILIGTGPIPTRIFPMLTEIRLIPCGIGLIPIGIIPNPIGIGKIPIIFRPMLTGIVPIPIGIRPMSTGICTVPVVFRQK